MAAKGPAGFGTHLYRVHPPRYIRPPRCIRRPRYIRVPRCLRPPRRIRLPLRTARLCYLISVASARTLGM